MSFDGINKINGLGEAGSEAVRSPADGSNAFPSATWERGGGGIGIRGRIGHERDTTESI
jgi:hypothetical protein